VNFHSVHVQQRTLKVQEYLDKIENYHELKNFKKINVSCEKQRALTASQVGQIPMKRNRKLTGKVQGKRRRLEGKRRGDTYCK
jgi:hypothetical protein